MTFYEHELDDATTDVTWSRLVSEDPALVGLVAEEDDELVGLCHLVLHPSTWSVGSYCYLEDLFVRSDHRLGGVGRAFIAAAVEEQSAATAEISRNLGGAREGATSVNENIGGVRQAAEETGGNTLIDGVVFDDENAASGEEGRRLGGDGVDGNGAGMGVEGQ